MFMWSSSSLSSSSSSELLSNEHSTPIRRMFTKENSNLRRWVDETMFQIQSSSSEYNNLSQKRIITLSDRRRLWKEAEEWRKWHNHFLEILWWSVSVRCEFFSVFCFGRKSTWRYSFEGWKYYTAENFPKRRNTYVIRWIIIYYISYENIWASQLFSSSALYMYIFRHQNFNFY